MIQTQENDPVKNIETTATSTSLDTAVPPHNRLWIGTALAAGWLFNLLFYAKPLGVSVLLFTLLILGMLASLGWRAGIHPVKKNLWLWLPIIFFAGMISIRAGEIVTTLNIFSGLALLAYAAFFHVTGRISSLSLLAAMLLPVRVTAKSGIQATKLLYHSVDKTAVRQKGSRNLFPILRGILIALPILLVFTALLASADMIFADYLDKIVNLDILPMIEESINQLLLILFVAWLLLGGLALALLERQTANSDDGIFSSAINQIPRHVSLGFTETATVLGLVNSLFLTFTLVQFSYLFGGNSNINIEGFTYAEYARQGFGELVAVAVMSLTLILGLNWITQRESKTQIKYFNSLGSLLIGFVLVMLVSAFRRMQLYESTFGYTELRLMTYIFMAWLGVLMVWFVWTLWKRPFHFPIGCIIVAISFVVTLNLINPDAFIARQNIARYQQTGDLDVLYLTQLSNDAVPQLVQALDLVQGDSELVAVWGYRCGDEPSRSTCEMSKAEILQQDIDNRYTKLQERIEKPWYLFHSSHWNAYRLLSQVASIDG